MNMEESFSFYKQQRVIRVFISSTFQDMVEERNELVKFIFPKLRKLCEQHGVAWGEVDLRWGITDEQKAEGKVLPICLDEIRRCRPYFIGLLGERYGWIPEEIPKEVMENEAWLADQTDHSITEMEILHGVLNNPAMAEHALFYFRDPAYIHQLPHEQRPAFCEEPTPEEIEQYGAVDARGRADLRREKLTALKQRIRSSGFPLKENYQNPQQLGEWVLEDLTDIINHLFPEGSQPDPLERETVEHETFAASRARVYIGRPEYFEQLDEHVQSDGPPMLVLGESGAGKSALLANWAFHHRQKNHEDLLIMHFIGATPASADWMMMIRRLMGEFKRRYEIEDDIPDQPSELRKTFSSWLHIAATKERVLLILDGLNQLEDRDQALDLVWLPHEIPGNVRLVLSTIPGRTLDALNKCSWPKLQIEPLTVEEQKRLITEYLAYFSKKLSPAHLTRITAELQTINPLYLRVLLDELRLIANHEQLDKYIEHYLGAKTVADLFELVLERYEQDYERDKPGLVREAMALLWAARRGLSEAELLELLGEGEQPMPRAYWSPLYLVTEPELINRTGLIGFFHNHLRQAVERRYLGSDGQKKAVHLRLADYFNNRGQGLRRVEEQPWQLAQAKAWKKLYGLLTDLDFFKTAWKENEFEIKTYWAQIEKNSNLQIVNGYTQVLNLPEKFDDRVVWEIGRLLGDAGHLAEASVLNKNLIQFFRRNNNQSMLAAVLGMQANNHYKLGDLDNALKLHKEEEQICRALDTKGGLAFSLINQAPILVDRGDKNEALVLYKEAGIIFRDLKFRRGLAKSLTGQAIILSEYGDTEKVFTLYRESEQICREIGEQDELVICLVNMGNTHFQRNELEKANDLYMEAESICRQTGNTLWLVKSVSNQANIHKERGDLDAALALYNEMEQLCRELGDKDDLQTLLGIQARIFEERGDLERALILFKEQERLCREMGDKHGLQNSLSRQAIILDTRSNPDETLKIQKENERLCREMGKQQELAISLIHQAVVLGIRMSQYETALSMANEAYDLAIKCGDATLAHQIDSIRGDIYARQ